jgi:hypothetical protein
MVMHWRRRRTTMMIDLYLMKYYWNNQRPQLQAAWKKFEGTSKATERQKLSGGKMVTENRTFCEAFEVVWMR